MKVEFTLVDQRSVGTPVKRTVSIVVADVHTGQIRSQSDVFGIVGGVPLNIDTSPELLPDWRAENRWSRRNRPTRSAIGR